MRRTAIFLVAFLSMGGNGSAQDNILTGNTVYQAIKCDIGRFAAIAEEMGLDPAMKAAIEISWSIKDSTGAEIAFGLQGVLKKFGISFGPTLKGAEKFERVGLYAIKGTFNVHEGNTKACGQKGLPQVWVGVFECLSGQVDPLRGGVTASCDQRRTFQGTLDAKLEFMYVGSVEGKYNATVTYFININVPVEEKTKVALIQ
jgi:hypothetical protein